MPARDGTGPNGTGPVGWRHGRCFQAGFHAALENESVITEQRDENEQNTRRTWYARGRGYGRIKQYRMKYRFSGGE